MRYLSQRTALLTNAEKTALVYGTILCWFGTVALAASLGEMASMFVSTLFSFAVC